MKFKTSFLALLVSFSMILAACSGEKSNSDSSSESSNNSSGLAQGVTDDQILIGHIGPQTGPVAIYDLIRKGIESYFNYVNENGGVNGRQLKLVAYDDQYQPAKTVQLVKRLVEEDEVFAMTANVGTATSLAVKDYIDEKGIPVIFGGSGAKVFVDPPLPNQLGTDMLNYGVEAKVFLDFAVNKLGAKKIALAYQNDDFGKEGYGVLKEAIKNYPDVELVEEVNFLSSDTEFSSQAQKLKEAKPDTILNMATPAPAANLKKAMHKIGLVDVNYIVSSVGANDNNLFNLAGKDVWEGTYSGATYPMPEAAPDNEKIQLYVERFSKDFPNDPVGGVSQLGWGSAQVLVEGIKRAGDDLTWENFLKTFYTFDNWDGSIHAGVTFSEDNHYGLTSMFMTQAKDGIITPLDPQISFNPTNGEISYSE
ncbi:ABC transporter substrate-binding protein [Bacillus dakarensis]|uniref:ABC transporter substrate-binding protein n=1 Tax=Robertmurraya dakarensis TaxID=1926278 RepID=UPI0009822243|nr:ABC transporter substrate-binding protein [Bacillus dakarensis]